MANEVWRPGPGFKHWRRTSRLFGFSLYSDRVNKLNVWPRIIGGHVVLPEQTCLHLPQALNPQYMSNLLERVHLFISSPFGLATLVIGAPVLVLGYRAVVYLSSPLFSPIRKLNGPPSPGYLLGHFKNLVNGNAYTSLKRYNEQYGNVYAIKAILGVSKFISVYS